MIKPMPAASLKASSEPLQAQLVTLFLSGKRETTLRAYRADLDDFRATLPAPTIQAAADVLLTRGHGPANASVMRYRAALLDRGLAPATVNRRLAAVRSLVELANVLGLVPWTLNVPGVKTAIYRDTKGPGRAGFVALLREAGEQRSAKAARDRAMLWLLFGLALRRAEVVELRRENLAADFSFLSILGKGHLERQHVTVPTAVRLSVKAWLVVRGDFPGPLFTSLDRAGKGDGGLTADGLYRLVRGLGRRVGLVVRPHGLRHASITSALDLGADLRSVQRFSRHADVRTLARYDDNRTDLGGKVAEMVAGSVPG